MKLFLTGSLMLLSVCAWSQVQRSPTPTVPQEDFTLNRPSTAPTSLSGEEYRIGKDDLVDVAVFEVPELGVVTRVTASGTISMPLIGVVQVAGDTPQQVERSIEAALKKNSLNDPHVTVFVREYASQPVSVIGAVKMPGIYQIKGQKFLLDMLALAQGLDQTNAGSTIQLMRKPVGNEAVGETITISTEDLFQNGKADLNIPIQAGDVINVLRAGSVFVVGEVLRPGEFVLREGKNVTATQAVALGGGFSKEAKKDQCMIIRVHRDGTKEEIPVNIAKILDASLNDVTLTPNDILFVPASRVKTGLKRALDTTIATLSARLVYRF